MGATTEHVSTDPASTVHAAITSRRSVRKFLPDPVPADALRRILTGAAYAPSGHNIQPWHVWVVTGAARDRVSAAVLAEIERAEAAGDKDAHQAEFDYYPTEWFEPYIGRRRATGFGLYAALGIDRKDYARRTEQMLENFRFFGAPVGMFLTFDRRLAEGTFMDIGMFIQTILIGARGEGLHSCGQVAWTSYHKIIRAELQIPDEQMFVCGISLGYEDPDAAANTLRVDKLDVDDFTTFVDS